MCPKKRCKHNFETIFWTTSRPSRLSWTFWANLSHFVLNILSPNTDSKFCQQLFGTPCRMQLPLFSSLCISVTSLAPLPPSPAPPFQQLQSVALISLTRLLTNSSSPHGINYRPLPGSSAFSFLFSSSFSSQAPPSSFLSSPFPFYPPSKAELFLLLLCLLKSSSSAFPSYFSSSLTNQASLSSPLCSRLESGI